MRGAASDGRPYRDPRMLSLLGYRPTTFATSGSLLFGSGARVDPAVAAVVADAVNPLVHSGVVNVVDGVGVHAVHRRVVEKPPVFPAAAFITITEVSKAIVDATIETYRQAPVAFIEHESVAAPTPVAWSPQVPGFGSHHPCARYPVILAIPSPISGRPHITVAGADGLLVDG